MGMSQSYGPADEGESIATLHRAIELGCNFFDTAEVYGPFTNE
jgi:aryl-alcohol dehydrogenase-like predicted oxidoreductase